MKDFKFFQKEEKGTLDIIDGVTYSSASFNADTPDGHVYRRHLYHTQREAYDRLRGVYDNERSEIPRGRFGTPERHQDILRRLQMTNDSRDLNDNPIRLFQSTRVTKVNPKWRTKIKMFFQEMKIKMYIQDNQDMFGVIFFATAVTICFGLIIGKILNAW
jgi:hypothetical protein